TSKAENSMPGPWSTAEYPQRRRGHGRSVETLMNGGAAAFGQFRSALRKADQFGQLLCEVGGGARLYGPATAGPLQPCGECAVSGLNDRNAVGQGLENVKAFRFAVDSRDRQHVECFKERHFARMVRGTAGVAKGIAQIGGMA